MSRINIKIYLLALLLLSITILSFVAVISKKSKNTAQIMIPKLLQLVASPIPTPIPSPSPTPSPKTQTKSQVSADGKVELIINSRHTPEKQSIYSFYVKAKDEVNKKLIFSQTVDQQTDIDIPFNTFAPDNKYFFVNQQTPNTNHFLVFKTSGEKFKEDLYLDITTFYLQKEIANQLVDVTGWAAPGLLILTTKQADDTQGQSYWFDVSNHSFIPLSTRF